MSVKIGLCLGMSDPGARADVGRDPEAIERLGSILAAVRTA
jgi:hypothetical protein